MADPFTLGAAGLGLIGSIFGSSSSKKQADAMIEAQRRENQLNREFNAAEAQKSRDYNSSLIDSYRQYNDPSEVMKRLQKAGLNPNLAYGSLSAQDTISSPSTAASYSGGISPTSFQPLDTSASAELLSRAGLQEAQKKNIEADTHGKNIDNEWKGKIKEQEFTANGVNIKLAEETLGLPTKQKEVLEANIGKMTADTKLADEQCRLLEQQVQSVKQDVISKELDNAFKDKTFQARVRQQAALCGISEVEYKVQLATVALRVADIQAGIQSKLSQAMLNSSLGHYYKAAQSNVEYQAKYILPRQALGMDVDRKMLSFNFEQAKTFDSIERGVKIGTSIMNSFSNLIGSIKGFSINQNHSYSGYQATFSGM